MERGRYFKSLKEALNAGYSEQFIMSRPSISATGSVKGMRKLYWGYSCDVVRVGNYIYRLSR